MRFMRGMSMPSSTKPASSVLFKRLSCLRNLFARRYVDWNIGKIYERVGNPTKAEVINAHCSRSHAHKNWQTSLLRQNNNGILVMLESNVLLVVVVLPCEARLDCSGDGLGWRCQLKRMSELSPQNSWVSSTTTVPCAIRSTRVRA